MALKKTIEFKGVPIVDAYIRVSMLTIHAGNTRMDFGVQTMANAESETIFYFSQETAYSLAGENPISQAYAHLKTLEQYQGAEDC